MRIGIGDHDRTTFEDLAPQLRQEEHQVLPHPVLADLLSAIRDAGAHLVVLEPADFPIRRALDLCSRLHRDAGALTLVVSRLPLGERLRLVEAGADDELAKPYDPAAVLAHAHALLRRHPLHVAAGAAGPMRVSDEWSLDVVGQRLTGPQGARTLRSREFRLLLYFLRHEGVVLSRGNLLAAVWELEDLDFSREVDRYVHHLRRKIEPDPLRPRYFLTRWDEGYEYRGPKRPA